MNVFKGFTLIELLITIAVVAILAAIAVPSYQMYMRRSYFTEVKQATGPYTLGVNHCYQTQGSLTNCNGGANGVPPNQTTTAGNVASVSVAAGVITVTPVVQNGIAVTDTFIMTPTVSNNTLVWTASGGCFTSGVC